MAEQAAGRMGRRLGRILVMLPYAIQHPGVSVGELARKFGTTKRDLMDDLQLVFMCGLPGYGPGDLIDVDLQEDRVYVRMADYFAAPLRLSPTEALVLYAGAATLAALPGMEEADALRRAVKKLEKALGAGNGGLSVSIEPTEERHLVTIREALEGRRQIELEYFSASRGEVTDRRVDPWGLVSALGRWYLIGRDHSSGEERMFRVDRVKAATALDAEAEVSEDFDPGAYRGAFRPEGSENPVTFEISPSAAAWFADYYPVQSTKDLADRWKEVTLLTSSDRWAAILALQLGADVRRIEPASVDEMTRTIAAKLAAAHASP